MSGARRPQDDAISLSSDSSPEQSPMTSPKVMPAVPPRTSVNNLGQPVRGPDFNRPLALSPNAALGSPSNQIDLTQDDEDDVVDQHGLDNNDEDEELRRAIAMSLQSHEEEQKRHEQAENGAGKQKESLMSDTSKEERQKSQSRTVSPDPAPSSALPTSNGLLGLDRKAMEAERLARLKRKRDGDEATASNPAPTQPAQTLAKAESTNEIQQKRPRTADKTASNSGLQARTRTLSPPATRSSASGPPKPTTALTSTTSHSLYLQGAILLTPSSTHQPKVTHPTISFTSLIAPTQSSRPLTSALLSSFTTDFDWLLPHFNTRTVSFAFVLHTVSLAHRQQLATDFGDIRNVKLIFPDCVGGMKGGGTMHGKLCLLFFAGDSLSSTSTNTSLKNDNVNNDKWKHGRLRIAIPTGNLTAHDWGEAGGVMENLVFVADLPMLPTTTTSATASNNVNNTTQKPKTTTPFQRSLTAYLVAQGVPQGVLTKLGRVDFSGLPKELAFVSSVAGFHWLDGKEGGKGRSGEAEDDDGNGSNVEAKYDGKGLWNLSSAVRELGLLPSTRLRGTTTTSTTNSAHHLEPEGTAKHQTSTTPPTVQIDYATSSLGALTNDFLPALYDAARGLPQPLLSATSSSGTSFTTSAAVAAASRSAFFSPAASSSTKPWGRSGGGNNDNPWRAHTSIYFPSAQTVGASRGGTDAAGTICFQEKWWERADFPREIVRDCVSVREGMLGHYKMLLVRSVVKEDVKGNGGVQAQTSAAADDGRDGGADLRPAPRDLRVGEGETVCGGRSPGFCYFGSANCSESAWGRAVFDKPNRVTKLTVRNWECGIAVPLASVSTTAGASSTNARRSDHHHYHDDADSRRHQSPAGGGGGDATTTNTIGTKTQASRPPERCEPLAALGRALPLPMRVPGESLVLSGKAPWFFGGFGGD